MRRTQQGQGTAGAVRVDEASCASTFRVLDDAFLQKQAKIWLGEVLHLRFDEDISVADVLADGELLFQVSKVIWKRLLKKNREQLKQSKVYIYERLSFGKSNGKYMPYSKVDSFLKICQILGLAGIDLFTPSDVVEKRNVRKVCICIRSVSKKAHMMRLNVPDFDIVTYTISMPNYIVGGIRRSLEQPQCSSSGSSGYSPRAKALQQQNDQNGDTHYDSDEAESKLSVLEPEDSVDEDNFVDMHSQLSDATKEKSESLGESVHDTPEEKSPAESVGSLNLDVMDFDSVDSTPLVHTKESHCSTQSATDRCSRTRTTKCSLSSEESDSISSCLELDGGKNDLELDAPPVTVSERISDGNVNPLDHSIQGNEEIISDSPKNGSVDLRKDTGILDRHCDALACDREFVCSNYEEPKYGLNGDSSDLSSVLTPRHATGGKLSKVSEDPLNNLEPYMNKANPVTGMTNDSTSRELNPGLSTEDDAGDKPVKSEDKVKNSVPQKSEDDAHKSGKGVLKSVAGGITLVGAVFFIVHLRRSKERSFTTVVPSLSGKSIQSDDSRATNMDKGKAAAVYPGEWLKV